MLLTISLGSGSFENGKKKKLAKNIYSSSDFGWIYKLLISTHDVMYMIISELQLSVAFWLGGQKFILKQAEKWKKNASKRKRKGRLA